MASGLPVIASNAAALPEVCNETALFFDPSDSDMLTNQLGAVLTNPQLRQDLALRGLVNARAFNIDAFRRSVMILSRPETGSPGISPEAFIMGRPFSMPGRINGRFGPSVFFAIPFPQRPCVIPGKTARVAAVRGAHPIPGN